MVCSVSTRLRGCLSRAARGTNGLGSGQQGMAPNVPMQLPRPEMKEP